MVRQLFYCFCLFSFLLSSVVSVEVVKKVDGIDGGNVTLSLKDLSNQDFIIWNVNYDKQPKHIIYIKVEEKTPYQIIEKGKLQLGANGVDLIISNLNFRNDSGNYTAVFYGDGNSRSIYKFELNVYKPPQGISFVPTTFRDTLTLTCGTIGGSKPPATINLLYKKNGKRMERIDVVELNELYLGVNGYKDSEARKNIENIGKINQGDTYKCQVINEKTKTILEKNFTLVAPSVRYGSLTKFSWLGGREIVLAQYASQAESDDLSNVKISVEPFKKLYFRNESVKFFIESHPNGIFPPPSHEWYVQTNYQPKLHKISEYFDYTLVTNATVFCVVKNIIGEVVLSIKVPVSSEYATTNLQLQQASSSQTTIIIIVVLTLFVIGACVVGFVFYNRKKERSYPVEEYPPITVYDEKKAPSLPQLNTSNEVDTGLLQHDNSHQSINDNEDNNEASWIYENSNIYASKQQSNRASMISLGSSVSGATVIIE